MSEATSVSKGPIVAKVLIDLSEYNTLLKAKQFQEAHEKKLKLEYVVKHNEPESEDGESLEKAVTTQVGQGSSKEDMTTLIKRLIQEQFQLSQIGQSGSGLNDLAPKIPMNVDIDDHQPMSGETSYSKSDQSSPISQQLLLGKVPKKKLEKATKLLQAFEERRQQEKKKQQQRNLLLNHLKHMKIFPPTRPSLAKISSIVCFNH